MEPPKATLKTNWTIEAKVKANEPDAFWLTFDTQPFVAINLGTIPLERRNHLFPGDLLIMTLDMEPRNRAQPSQPPVE